MIGEVLGKKVIPTAGDLSMLKLPPSQISKQPYYIIVPGSVDEKRMYPGEKFAFIINGIRKAFPFLTPVITGTEKEKPIAEKVIRMCDSPSNIIDLTGKSSLMELFANIAGAGFIISNDTGAIHAGAKYRKKVFTFSGFWHGSSFTPKEEIYPHFTVFRSPCDTPFCCENCHKWKEGEPFPCLKEISEKEALETILDHLKKDQSLVEN